MRSTRTAPLHFEGDGTIRRLVRRNLSVILGLALLAFAAVIAASLATWTVDDPSFSHATDHAARNMLGIGGAIVADLLMQFFGLASIILLLPPVIWSWRLVFAEPSRFGWTPFATWLLGTLAGTLALATLPLTRGWPLPTGLGGVTGDLLLRIPAFALGTQPTGWLAAALCLLFALMGTGLALTACGFLFWREKEEEDEIAAAKIPAVRPSKRVIVEDDEADDAVIEEDDEADEEDDTPSRFSLFLGAAAHSGLRLASSIRRLAFRQGARAPARRLFDHALAPAPGLVDRRRVEPTIGDDFREPKEDAGETIEPAPKLAPRISEPPPKPRPAKRKPAPAKGFELPPLELLAEPKGPDKKAAVNLQALEENARLLEGVLDDFGVRGEIINVRPGPVVTLYELEPAPGIKSARVIGLADDIARSMSAIACRVSVIPGKNAIGIELPNARRETVYLRELLASEDFVQSKTKLGLCLGKTIGGEPVVADLARMPHLLVAGTTGSGKSVSINTMILSLLYRLKPEDCRMIMIDPKMLELSTYDGIPHLMTPVVTDPKQAVVALKWTVREMEDRYRKMSKLGVRNIDGYNLRLNQARSEGEALTRTVQTGFDPHTGEPVFEQEDLPPSRCPTSSSSSTRWPT